MEEADGKTAAETALLLEQEIDKRVGMALAKLLYTPMGESYAEQGDMASLSWELIDRIGDQLMSNDSFRRAIVREVANKLQV